MGNQSSRSLPQSPAGSSVTPSHGGAHPQQQQQQPPPPPPPPPHPNSPHLHPHSTARRRESIPGLATVKAQAAPPSASFENVESQPSTGRQRARAHSHTVVSSPLGSATFLSASATATMGNDQSKHGGRNGESGPSGQSAQIRQDQQNQPIQQDEESGQNGQIGQDGQAGQAGQDGQAGRSGQERGQDRTLPARQYTPLPLLPTASPSPPVRPEFSPSPSPHTAPVRVARPVDVPGALRDVETRQDYLVPSSQFSRPPRLPLPIEEELYTPGSPIITPQDYSNPLEIGEAEGILPRRSSILSTTTADDDDLGDEFKGPNADGPTVPTLIEWDGPGERVYVTGTFAGWNKKYKLHRDGPSKLKDALSAHVLIAPGTHHLMFIVDNDMRTSSKLPTAVDYTNILVNYLEVSCDQDPAIIPTPVLDKEAIGTEAYIPTHETSVDVSLAQALPPTPELQPIKAPPPESPKPKTAEPSKRYHQIIPHFLLDLDAPVESTRFARANAITNHLPAPPTLPGFLGKSILNGTTPMKDDSSVLIHPNHTVLNHLATSSIKDSILATSATTRYKQKFLTTIMYRPKEQHGRRAA